MRVAILTVGSRGDVQPFVALGLGLKEAGHEVTLAAGKGFESTIQERGLRFAPLDVDLLERLQSPEGKATFAGRNLFGTMRQLMHTFGRMLDDEWAASRGTDVVLYHPKALDGYHVAEALGVPAFLAHPVSMFTPTRAFPNPVLPVADLGGASNAASYGAFLRLMTAPYGRLINRWRARTLGLPPHRLLASELELRGALDGESNLTAPRPRPPRARPAPRLGRLRLPPLGGGTRDLRTLARAGPPVTVAPTSRRHGLRHRHRRDKQAPHARAGRTPGQVRARGARQPLGLPHDAGGGPRSRHNGAAHRLSAPTLLIGGSEDPFFPPALVRETAEKITGAELRFLGARGTEPPRSASPASKATRSPF